MKTTIIITLLGLAFASHAEATEIYKWTNAKGEPVYSQTPPPNGSTATIITLAESPADKKKDMLAETSLDHNAPTPSAEKKMDNCEIARTNIALLRVANPETQFAAADGEDVTYTQAELNSRIQSNQEIEKAWCKQ